MAISLIIDTAGGSNFAGYDLRNVASLHVGGSALADATLQVTGTVHITGAITADAAVAVGTQITPDANDGASLGVSGTAWSDLFLASGAVINWAAGNYTLTHAAGQLTASGDLIVTGALTVNGNITLGNAAGDALVVNATATFNENITVSSASVVLDTGTLVADTVTVSSQFDLPDDLIFNIGDNPSYWFYYDSTGTQYVFRSNDIGAAVEGNIFTIADGTDDPVFVGIITAAAFIASGIAGLDVNPGSDADADLLTVGVTGTPRLWWDESDDRFTLTHGLDIDGGALNASGGGALTGTWSNLGTVTTVDINGGTLSGVTVDGSLTWSAAQNFATGTTQIAALTTSGAVSIGGVAGVDFTPGGDLDVDLLTVGVTGAPRLWWDESEDSFSLTHGLDITGGSLDVGTMTVTSSADFTGATVTGFTPNNSVSIQSIDDGASHTGNTNETTLFTYSIAAGDLDAGDAFRLRFQIITTGANDTKTVRVRQGAAGPVFYSVSHAAGTNDRLEVEVVVFIDSATRKGRSTQWSEADTNVVAKISGAGGTGGAFDLLITGQLANGSDSVAAENVTLEYMKP